MKNPSASVLCRGYGLLLLVLAHLLATPYALARGENRPSPSTLRDICAAAKTAIFVEHKDWHECLPYYVIGNLSSSSDVIIFIPGDITDDKSTQEMDMFQAFHAYIFRSIEAFALERVPILIISRPGLFGATGSYWHRHRELEYALVRQAVVTISMQLRIKHLALVGHSGGSSVVMGGLSLGPSDSDCIIVGSGVYELSARLARRYAADGLLLSEEQKNKLAHELFSHHEHMGSIKNRKSRRLFMIGDPNDMISPLAQQHSYAVALQKAGHRVLLVESTSRNHHDFVLESLVAAARCLKGEDDARIISILKKSQR